MANIYKGTLGLIGNTPLVEVTNVEKELGLEATILVKLEYFNPAGSVKDRIAKAMIEDAEAKGILKEGSVIIEPTSGNTGIGLAAVATAKSESSKKGFVVTMIWWLAGSYVVSFIVYWLAHSFEIAIWLGIVVLAVFIAICVALGYYVARKRKVALNA